MAGPGWAVGAVAISLAAIAGGSVVARSRRLLADALFAVAGAALGTAGLLVQHDVPSTAWALAPAIGAALGVIHARALMAGAGPFRT